MKKLVISAIVILSITLFSIQAVIAKPEDKVWGHHHLGGTECEEDLVQPNRIENGEWDAGKCDAVPTDVPTDVPTEVTPTDVPTEAPTEVTPTDVPPTDVPTEVTPTEVTPTDVPTEVPTEVVPTDVPTEVPTEVAPTEVTPISTPVVETPKGDKEERRGGFSCGFAKQHYYGNQDNSQTVKFLRNHRCRWYYFQP